MVALQVPLSFFIIASLLPPSTQAAFSFIPSSLSPSLLSLTSSSSSSSSKRCSFEFSSNVNHHQSQNRSRSYNRNFHALFYTDDDNNNSNNNNKGGKKKMTKTNSVRRTSVKGISVSPSGFLVLLHTRSNNSNTNDSNGSNDNNGDCKNIILPIRITSTKKDAYATTSAESLTICQLLSGVDMAGAILSPDVLKNMIGLYCSSSRDDEHEHENEHTYERGGEYNENDNDCILVEDELGLEMPILSDHEIDDDNESDDHESDPIFNSGSKNNNARQEKQQEKQTLAQEFVHNFLSTSFDSNTHSFEEASAYQRSRIIFPKISLDSIRIDLPLSSTSLTESENENVNEDRSTTLWNDMVMREVVKEQKKENQNQSVSMSNDEHYGNEEQVLAPLPLQFVLECRVDGDKTLDIPLYTEVDTIKKSISYGSDGDRDDDGDSSSYEHMCEHILEESRNIMQQVLYSYDDQCSGAFLSMALALRYKCPIVISSRALDAIEAVQSTIDDIQKEDGRFGTMSVCIQQIIKSNTAEMSKNTSGDYDGDDDEEEDDDTDFGRGMNGAINEEDKAIQSILPQWRSTNALQSQSKRVVENIEQGFQLTKLQGALKIALQRGDDLAAEKIRAEIDKLLGKDE